MGFFDMIDLFSDEELYIGHDTTTSASGTDKSQGGFVSSYAELWTVNANCYMPTVLDN